MTFKDLTDDIISKIADDSDLREWAQNYTGDYNFEFIAGKTILKSMTIDDSIIFEQTQIPYNPMIYLGLPIGFPHDERACRDSLTYQIVGFLKPGTYTKPLDGIQDFLYYILELFRDTVYTTQDFDYRFMAMIGSGLNNPADPDIASFAVALNALNSRGG